MKIIMNKYCGLIIALACIIITGCKVPAAIQTPPVKQAPVNYTSNSPADTANSADINWKDFYSDKYLTALIDTAVKNNPDLLIALQDIEIARYKVSARNSELFPSVSAGGALGIEKVGRYTSQGAGDASTEITPGKPVPESLTDMYLGIKTTWEADIWGKLRSAKNAAIAQYLGTIEGRKFVLTNLVAEVANSYYELLSLDNQLDIIRESIRLQQNQLEIIKVEKEAAVVTELAVKQFEAQVLNSQGMEYDILQQITATENKLNFLLGRYPQKILREKTNFLTLLPGQVKTGIPSQLLRNRPDIKAAEYELEATKWDVKAAQRAFYPSLDISATLGMQAFKPSFFYKMPESLIYSLAGDLAGPIINRKAIIAEFKTANALQVEAMYEYQKAIVNGFVEVSNELSGISNLEKMYGLKTAEVNALTRSVDISNDLFKSARANYLEVLTAQRDALSAKLELIEVKKKQLAAVTNLYRALGGGWK